MKNLLLLAKLDLKGSFRSKWFIAYFAVFAAGLGIFFVSGVMDSRVAGFSGLTRMLLLFVQVCVIVLPIFILISTVRSLNADREFGTLEYLLSFPVSLGTYYFGKILGRAVSVSLPIVLSLVFALVFALAKGARVDFGVFVYYAFLLLALGFCFLAFGFLLGSIFYANEAALAAAFLLWLFLLAFLDLALMGLLMRSSLSENFIFALALLNPLEVFRIAAVALFEPNLSVIGPAAYFILRDFGRTAFCIYAFVYPIVLGAICLAIGYFCFSKRDLV